MDYFYPRQIDFEAILNFRDLGGYKTRSGKMVAWRRLFRSAEMYHMTIKDMKFLEEEIGIHSIIDLRNYNLEFIGPINKIGVKYYSVPLFIFPVSQEVRPIKEIDLYKSFTNSGEIYLHRIRQKEYIQKIIEALEIIAEPKNYPLVFHCNAGKDRSGIIAAIVLSILGVEDDDIIKDYAMTEPIMEEFINRWNNDPKTADVHKNLPEYQLHAYPESMALFLTTLQREYGSIRGFIKENGAEKSLFSKLEKTLLI
ncbi:MAG: tyrosine-protein phosphatase [Dehalococcoidales bacterium]|nr:tyrosine-protein phosphatase [Dehalococcoidales bacterium]